MARPLTTNKLVVASHNPGKIREIQVLIKPFGIEAVSAADLNLPEPVENGWSFAENASIKALTSATASTLPALSDDSGLCVPALGGQPGIYSARWAGPDKDFRVAMKKVIDEVGDKPRDAYFFCALAISWPDRHTEIFEGRVDGHLTWPPKGDKGFGYDPIFIPKGFKITFGEMDPDKKHNMSHRADAFRKFVAACLER